MASLAAQLARLSTNALGGQLRRPRQHGRTGPWQAAEDVPISLGQVLADRTVTLFTLNRQLHGPAAAMIARLAVADLTRILADLAQSQVRTDCLVWINGCEAVGRRQLADLVALGPATGTAVLVSTAADAAAGRLAADVGTVLVRGPAPPSLGTEQPGLAADALCLHARGPRERVVTGRAAR